jgi:hypothetical protein
MRRESHRGTSPISASHLIPGHEDGRAKPQVLVLIAEFAFRAHPG